jgi:hypothetical protein
MSIQLSFRLTYAPAYFICLMNKVFMWYLDQFMIVFIKDILIFSKHEEALEKHLCLASQKLSDKLG